MAGKSAAPLLLLAGGAALLLGKKKKKSSSKADTGPTYDDLPSGDDTTPYDIPTKPAPKPSAPDRPSGSPPRGDQYDAGYWGSTPEERRTAIREHFKYLGYPVEVGPWPMNILGPKGSEEMENIDGTKGKLGGDDDKPNETVRLFQKNYNQVSRLNKAEKIFPAKMGGLDKDGLVGPYTLNGLRYAVEELKAGKGGGKTWKDLISMAELKGIN